MRALAIVLLLLLAGCATKEAPAATDDVDPGVGATPSDGDATAPTGTQDEVPPAPRHQNASLELSCHVYLSGAYVYLCPTGTGAPQASPRSMDIDVRGVERLEVVAQRTAGDTAAQVIARDEAVGTYFFRTDLRGKAEFTLTPADWGDLETVTIELAGGELYRVGPVGVWATYNARADVSVQIMDAG